MLISEAFDNYNLRIMSSGGSTNTSSAYRYACKSIITYFGNIDITEIKLEGIQKYYLSLVRDHSQGTARNYTMCLKAVIGICYRQGLKTVNPDNIIVMQYSLSRRARGRRTYGNGRKTNAWIPKAQPYQERPHY